MNKIMFIKKIVKICSVSVNIQINNLKRILEMYDVILNGLMHYYNILRSIFVEMINGNKMETKKWIKKFHDKFLIEVLMVRAMKIATLII